jgi:cerevisin
MRGLIALSLAYTAAAAPSFSYETIHDGAAPILSATGVEAVPNSYIIKFKDHVSEASAADHHSWVQNIHGNRANERVELRKRSQFPIVDEAYQGLAHTLKIGSDFLAYSGHFDEETIEEVRRHPDVSFAKSSTLFLSANPPQPYTTSSLRKNVS